MRAARIAQALDSGAWLLPASGDIAVYRPRIGDDLSALPKARVVVLTGFKPDHDHFAALGYRTTPANAYAAALVCLPRAKAEAHALLAEAASAPLIAVDGQKTDGIDAVLQDCRALGLTVSPTLSKAHGKFATVQADARLSAWRAQDQPIAGGFITRPGVFSASAPDRGSVLLAQALPADLPSRVADLGAGWGYLSRAVLARPGVKHLDVIEAEQVALTCARHNLPDPRAAFHWADVPSFRPDHLWRAVVMNPPFHTGRDAEPDLGLSFIRAAQRGLTPDGTLWLVANRHLPYAKALKTAFREVSEIGGDGTYRVTRAAYPVRQR